MRKKLVQVFIFVAPRGAEYVQSSDQNRNILGIRKLGHSPTKMSLLFKNMKKCLLLWQTIGGQINENQHDANVQNCCKYWGMDCKDRHFCNVQDSIWFLSTKFISCSGILVFAASLIERTTTDPDKLSTNQPCSWPRFRKFSKIVH